MCRGYKIGNIIETEKLLRNKQLKKLGHPFLSLTLNVIPYNLFETMRFEKPTLIII
jgi:hypothetical protein